MYIYLTTNLINGKIYIGQCTKPVEKSVKYLGSGQAIKKAIQKYGFTNFKKEILLDGILNINELNRREKFFICLYQSLNPHIGYNLSKGGDGCFGFKNTEETKIKRVESWKNWNELNPNAFIGANNGFYGKNHTDETKQLISNYASQKIGDKNGFYNKEHSEETKQIISEKQKQFHQSCKEQGIEINKHNLGKKFDSFVQDKKKNTWEEKKLNNYVSPNKGKTPNKKYSNCIHCNFYSIDTIIKRFHNDNCKLKHGTSN